jgi:hypothetical protein
MRVDMDGRCMVLDAKGEPDFSLLNPVQKRLLFAMMEALEHVLSSGMADPLKEQSRKEDAFGPSMLTQKEVDGLTGEERASVERWATAPEYARRGACDDVECFMVACVDPEYTVHRLPKGLLVILEWSDARGGDIHLTLNGEDISSAFEGEEAAVAFYAMMSERYGPLGRAALQRHAQGDTVRLEARSAGASTAPSSG